MSLNRDLQEFFLSHLSIQSLARFCSVCKGWREMIRPFLERAGVNSDQQLFITKMQASFAWLFMEMKPGETVRQTVDRFKSEVQESGDDFTVNLQKVNELKEDIDNATLWDGNIESKTYDEIGEIFANIERIADSMLPRFSDEE